MQHHTVDKRHLLEQAEPPLDGELAKTATCTVSFAPTITKIDSGRLTACGGIEINTGDDNLRGALTIYDRSGLDTPNGKPNTWSYWVLPESWRELLPVNVVRSSSRRRERELSTRESQARERAKHERTLSTRERAKHERESQA